MSAQHQYIQADDDDLDDLSFGGPSEFAKPAASSSNTTSASQQGLSGRIGQDPNKRTRDEAWNGIRMQTRYTGESTLDEPVSKTIMRDLLSIYSKLLQVLYPPKQGGTNELLREWDLWGPLVICLALAIILSIDSPGDQSIQVFSMVITLVTIGSVVVTVNAKLLGGRVSFFQSLCVLGYCLFPLLAAAVISSFLHNLLIRLPVSLIAWAWAVWASMNFLGGTKLDDDKKAMAVYPLTLFYGIVCLFCIQT
ncbi:hypothetical protein NliqN6_1999 [Naganishia liquefaciens]|uniref:Protein YIP n=1 Tax=Naganishia liquefaciens TaxID=104408 RepID=A0A8H3TQZ6_9TREE|nr:hypothetical protein NliqN6_1999 [Naganishia liquefaciens]